MDKEYIENLINNSIKKVNKYFGCIRDDDFEFDFYILFKDSSIPTLKVKVEKNSEIKLSNKIVKKDYISISDNEVKYVVIDNIDSFEILTNKEGIPMKSFGVYKDLDSAFNFVFEDIACNKL